MQERQTLIRNVAKAEKEKKIKINMKYIYLSHAHLDFNKLLSQEMHKEHNKGYIKVSFIIKKKPHTQEY